MNKLTILFVLALISVAACAQTYTQSKPTVCRVSTFECQNIPLTTGDTYTFDAPYNFINVGAGVFFDTTGGHIVSVPVPAHWNQSGPFQFTFSLNDGRSGTVNGYMMYGHAYRWTYAIVESSTVTFN